MWPFGEEGFCTLRYGFDGSRAVKSGWSGNSEEGYCGPGNGGAKKNLKKDLAVMKIVCTFALPKRRERSLSGGKR